MNTIAQIDGRGFNESVGYVVETSIYPISTRISVQQDAQRNIGD